MKDLKEIFPKVDENCLVKPRKEYHVQILNNDLAKDFLHWMGHEIQVSNFLSITESPDSESVFIVANWDKHGDIFILQLHKEYVELSTESNKIFMCWSKKLADDSKRLGLITGNMVG